VAAPPVLVADRGRGTAPVDAARVLAEPLGLPVERVPAPDAAALADRADERGAALLVVGPDLDPAVVARVLDAAPCAVLVVPAGPPTCHTTPRRIGVAWDGSAGARAALRTGGALAEACGAELRLLSVAGRGPRAPWIERLSRGAAQAPVGRHVAFSSVLLQGDAVAALRGASEDLDVLVCGPDRPGRFARPRVARRLAGSLGCALLVAGARARGRHVAIGGLTSQPDLPMHR
jgi:nucleotide-binding universal stress UspA family protein